MLKLAEGLAVLELKAPAGAPRTFSATLVWDEYGQYRVRVGSRQGSGQWEICYHGGIVDNNANKRIAKLTNG